MNIRLTFHIQEQARTKGIDLEKIGRVLQSPARITPVTKYPNQSRFIGEGIAIIVDTCSQAAITVYLDGVITPLRPDQIARGETIRRTH
jgi:hypothetical protein